MMDILYFKLIIVLFSNTYYLNEHHLFITDLFIIVI